MEAALHVIWLMMLATGGIMGLGLLAALVYCVYILYCSRDLYP